MKRISLTLLVFILMGVAAACQGGAPAEKAGPTVSLRVEGISEPLAYDPAWPLTQDASVLDLICALLDRRDIPYDVESGYLLGVGNDAAGAFGEWDGFLFYLNGAEQTSPPGTYLPKEGDEILICYADPSAEAPTQPVNITAQRGSDGLVTLTVLGGTMMYTQEMEGHLEYTPVGDVELTVDEVSYLTDGNGQLTLDETLSAKKSLSLQAEKYTEDGKPLLIRLAPDFTLSLPD